MQYAEFELGQASRDYLLSSLRNNIALARALAAHIQNEAGSVTALLPATTPIERVQHLESGGVAGYGASMRFLHGIVNQSLRDNSNSVVIVDRSLAKPNDPMMARSAWIMLTFADEVYYNITEEVKNAEAFVQVLLRCHSAIGFLDVVGVVTQISPGLTVSKGGVLSQIEIQHIAEGARLGFFGAFDGESYLIWRSGAVHEPQARFDGPDGRTTRGPGHDVVGL